ncbi:MAG: O-antigen ligase family protein [Bacteroidota bacterium]
MTDGLNMQHSLSISYLLRQQNSRQLIILLLIFLVDLKAIMGKSPVWSLVPILLMGLFLIIFAIRRASISHIILPRIVHPYTLLFLLVYVGLVCIAVIRTNSFLETALGGIIFSVKSFLAVSVSIYLLMRFYQQPVRHHRILSARLAHSILLGLSMYLGLQIAGGLLLPGYTGELNRGVIAGALGFRLPFSSFPLSGGHPNSVGVIGGVLFVLAALSWWFFDRREKNHLIIYGAGLISLIIMVVADSRGTILNAFLGAGLVIGLQWIGKSRWLLVFIWLVPFAQLGMLAGMKAIANSSVGTQLSRGKKDLATGNSRAYIYQYSFEHLADLQNEHLYGYGEYGPYKAGFIWKYIDKFEVGPQELTRIDIILLSVSHNAALQIIFDSGYIGLFIFLLSLFLCFKDGIWLYEHQHPIGMVLVGFVLYYVLSGITESASGRYNEAYYLILIVMLLTMAMARNSLLLMAFSPLNRKVMPQHA